MYYLFDTCTTRCSINAHTRPRSHLRIVPIGSDNTSRTKCASSDSEIASNFSLSLSRPGETGKSRRKKRFEAGNAARYTFAPFHAAQCARPSFASHPSARWILLGATDYHARSCSPNPCRSLQTMRIGAFSVQNFFHPRRGHHVLTLAKSVESGRAARRFYANFAPSFRFQPLLLDYAIKNVNGKKYYEGKFSFHNS